MFCFDFRPMGKFDLFVTGRSHFSLRELSLSFNDVMITLTSAPMRSLECNTLIGGLALLNLPQVR